MRRSRGVAMVGLVLAVAAGTIVASLTVSTNAAVVNGQAISQSSLDSDLSTISSHPDLQCVVVALSDVAVSGAGVASGSLPGTSQLISIPDPATYSSQFAAYWLNERIAATLARQWLDAHGLTVSAYAHELAEAHLSGVVQSIDQERSQGATVPAACPSSVTALSEGLPPGFWDSMVGGLAAQYEAALAQAGRRLTAAAVADYYGAHRSDFDQVCSIILPTRTEAEAAQVLQAVEAGTSFEELAASNGGSSGCATPAVNEIAQVAAGLPSGAVSEPLQAGPSDYLLIERQSSAAQPLSSVRDDVVQALVKAAVGENGREVAEIQRNSHVWVDPRYGHWVPPPVFSLETWHAPASGTLLCPEANIVVSPATARCPATPETGAATVNVTPAHTPTTGPSNRGARKS